MLMLVSRMETASALDNSKRRIETMNKEDIISWPLAHTIKEIFKEHKELIVYAIVGALTTAVSWLTSFVLKLFLDDQILWQNAVINTLSWIAAIAFAYPANRKYVFESKNNRVVQECAEFVGSRLATGVMEIGLMAVSVNALNVNFWISKIAVSIIIIIANYVLSKLFVFRDKTR